MIKVSELEKKVKDLGYDLTSLPDEEAKLFERLIGLRESKGRLVRHFKGNFYLFIDVAEHTEINEKLAIYKALYGEYRIHARPLDMFLSKVDKEKYPDADQEYRFEFVEIK